jgi:hypothetical protein
MSSIKAIAAGALHQAAKENRQRPVKAEELHSENPGTIGGSDSLILGLVLFFSGAAALMYQVLWIRQLSLVVGGEVYSSPLQ